MMMDEFSAPLGQRRAPRPARSISTLHVAIGAGAMAAALVAGWARAERALREEAKAAAPVAARAAALPSEQAGVSPPTGADTKPEPVAAAQTPVLRTITIIDGTTGKRREVIIPETADVTGFEPQFADPPLPVPTAASLGAGPRASVRPLQRRER